MVRVACKKEIPPGVRCRTLVNGSGLCQEHAQSVGGFCRPPDAVEFVLPTNHGWQRKFQVEGLSVESPYQGLRINYVEEASALGINPYYYGGTPTSGTAVFGVQGTTNVSIEQAWSEIQTLHYELTRLKLVSRTDSPSEMADLHVEFTLRPLQATEYQTNPFFWKKAFTVAEQLVRGCWGTLRVWVNPPRASRLAHAVVVSQRNVPGSTNVLLFEDGVWGIR